MTKKLDTSNLRIAIIGPSNSGKSTLSMHLSEHFDLPLLHLDKIAHKPHTNWERTDINWFIQKHDDFIQQDNWIIEGNYGICMPQRFKKATHIIWCDAALSGCIYRYIKRSLGLGGKRIGSLEGAKREFSFKLLKYTLLTHPKNKKKYKKIIAENPHLSTEVLTSFKQVKEYFQNGNLAPNKAI